MAVDAALMAHAAATGEGTFRLYSWRRPTISFGRHERTRGRYRADRLTEAGLDVVRRPTGGRALLHADEVTYSVTVPAGGATLQRRLEAINDLLIDALARLGVRAERAVAFARPTAPGHSACFSEPNRGELVVAGRKLVASAQLVEGEASLQHGSILITDAQWQLAELSDEPTPPTRAAALAEILGHAIPADDVGAAISASLRLRADDIERCAVGHAGLPASITDASVDVARFADPAWTWHR